MQGVRSLSRTEKRAALRVKQTSTVLNLSDFTYLIEVPLN